MSEILSTDEYFAAVAEATRYVFDKSSGKRYQLRPLFFLQRFAEGQHAFTRYEDLLEKSDEEYVQTVLPDIEELQRKLNNSSINAHKLKEMVAQLEQQLEEKNKELEDLRMQLQLKDQKIAQLSTDVSNRQSENETMKASKEQTEMIARSQDEQLNSAWYVVGTSKQLKEHKILGSSSIFRKSKVLKEDFDVNYMTKIDIRKTTVIPLSSKSADILTTHPTGTYTLLKDSKGLYTLRISDPAKFWSVSKYLVIKVK